MDWLGDGIGRHAGLRSLCRKVCGFESRPSHLHTWAALDWMRLRWTFFFECMNSNHNPSRPEFARNAGLAEGIVGYPGCQPREPHTECPDDA